MLENQPSATRYNLSRLSVQFLFVRLKIPPGFLNVLTMDLDITRIDIILVVINPLSPMAHAYVTSEALATVLFHIRYVTLVHRHYYNTHILDMLLEVWNASGTEEVDVNPLTPS